MSERLCGSFVVERIIGGSASGPVYRGRHASSGLPAWLYTLSESSRADEPAAREFHRRRHAAAALGEHPRVWRFLESGAHGPVLYYAVSETGGAQLAHHAAGVRMRSTTQISSGARRQFTDGHSREAKNDSWLSSSYAAPAVVPDITPWTIRTWLSDLLSAVSYAHQRGIFLGNLSPYNVWINLDGSASLVDTGSGTLHDWPTPDSSAAVTGDAGRRSDYLAPEQVLGWTVGPGADIYAVGAILFWLLGGVFPPAGRGDLADIGRYMPLPSLPAGADPLLAAVCEKATALQARSRYRTADLLRADLVTSPDERAEAVNRAARAGRATIMYHTGSASTSSPRPGAPPVSRPGTSSGSSAWLIRWLQGRL